MASIRDRVRAFLRPSLGQKASAIGAMIARLVVDRPVWPGIDYEKLAKEGYQQNPIVAHAVDEIARAVASIPIVAYKGKGKSRKEVENHPVLELLRNPNLDQDGVDLLEAAVSFYVLTGNLYLERTHETDPKRCELYVWRPDRTKVLPGADGLPAAYEYSAGGSKRRIDVNFDSGDRPVLHMKRFNPINDWYGQSPLQPCAWAVDLVNEASAWNLGILRNSGSPSGAFVFAPKSQDADVNLSDDQYERLRRQMEENVQGSRNAGRPMILDGGMDWKQMGLNPEQMQYVEGAQKAAREIAIVLGVPPQMLAIPGDNTYSNYQEARQAFYQETVIPLARKIVSRLSHWFARQLGEGVYLDINTDNLEALASVRKEIWDRIDNCVFLTINEKREAVGYADVDGGDEIYVGAGQVPINIDAIAGDSAEADPQPKPKPKGKPAGKGVGFAPGALHRWNDLP